MDDHDRSVFANAWQKGAEAYADGAVNSECTLQALVYAELRVGLAPRIVLCEPQINVESLGTFVPDIVVLDSDKVVAVVELKFVPNGYPVFENDLRKLAAFARSTQSFPVTLDPASGQFSSKLFHFAEECLLIFGAVGKHDALAIDEQALRRVMMDVGARFVPLVLPVWGHGCATTTAQ